MQWEFGEVCWETDEVHSTNIKEEEEGKEGINETGYRYKF